MLREKKVQVVKDLAQDFSDYKSMIVTHYQGLTVHQMTNLRAKLFEAGIKFVVVKNRLVKLALKDSLFVSLENNFSGPTAIALSNDPVAVAKILSDFAKENEQLKLLTGIVEGSEIDSEGIKRLSKMPSLDELRAKIISLLQTPASSVASILTAPASSLVRVVGAYSEGKN